jgi:3-phosphoshikimate 1-carboxyvinyltransferase
MNSVIIPPKSVSVSVNLPASKSISNRALIINALCGGSDILENLSDSDDTKAMINAFSADSKTVDIGAAGTAMRFLTAYFAQSRNCRILTGSDRMKHRPVKILADALNSVGADIQYLENDGFPPLKILGKQLSGGMISLDGGISSQYVSALMMIAPLMTNGLTINLKGNVISRPYIDMTARLMGYFGVKTEIKGDTIAIAPQQYTARRYKVESDWSAASYWYEIAALSEAAEISLYGLSADSLQGDSRVAELFRCLSVETRFEKSKTVLIRHKSAVLPVEFEYDFTDIPDLAQTFAVTCCMLGIKFKFTGLQSLKIKETDRIVALQTELMKLGFILETKGNSILEWDGQTCEAKQNPVIATYEDHRMAMAFAPVCLRFGTVTINSPQVVAKSYPGFWDDLKKAGFTVSQ